MPPPSFLGPFQDVPNAALAGAVPAAQTEPSKHLAVSMERPVPSNWCWAATAAAVSSFYATLRNIGQTVTACQVASVYLSTPCCPAPSDPNDPRNRKYALEGALDDHLAQDPLKGSLDFDTVVQEITGNRPVCCHIAWDPNDPDNGHFNVISGYDEGNQDVDVCDCVFGDQTLPFATFTAAYQSKGKWDWTYLTK